MGWICTPLVHSTIRWIRDYGAVWWTPERLRPISYAKNWCAKKFMESDCTHFWMVDADTIPPPDALNLLLEAECDIVAADVKTMKLDIDGIEKPVRMLMRGSNDKYYEAHGTGVERVDRIGFGCVLFRRRIFEMVEFPWFEERSWGEIRGTDFTFCKKLEELDIPIYGHFDVICKHRKEWDL